MNLSCNHQQSLCLAARQIIGEASVADALSFRAGNPLPRNFEKIVLDKKFRDKLLQLGIPYYQESIRGGGLEME